MTLDTQIRGMYVSIYASKYVTEGNSTETKIKSNQLYFQKFWSLRLTITPKKASRKYTLGRFFKRYIFKIFELGWPYN